MPHCVSQTIITPPLSENRYLLSLSTASICLTTLSAASLMASSAIFAESIGAVPGADKTGPTALLKSAMVFDQTLAKSGTVLQLKFPKKIFNSESGKKGFKTLAKTYFAGGGQMLQINVVSREELLDAQEHPENHRNLVVRVGGYSSYFNWLDKNLQNNVIARTEQNL